jgi:hypothetical protein
MASRECLKFGNKKIFLFLRNNTFNDLILWIIIGFHKIRPSVIKKLDNKTGV